MAFIIAVTLAMVVAHQAQAGCILPPPGSLTAPPAPVPCSLSLPSDACGPLQTQITQNPDINFDLPLPEEIPLGRFCACQKYGITPSLKPCPPRAAAPAPAPQQAPGPAVVSIPAAAPASPRVLYSAPAPASVVYSAPAPAAYVYSAPAPAAVVYSAPAPCSSPAVSVSPAAVSAFLRGGSCGCA